MKKNYIPINIRNILFFSLIAFFSSCDNNVVFEKNIPIPESKWEAGNIIRLDADIIDTTTPLNMYINIRNGGKYEFSNLFLFFTTHTPKGQTACDTLELPLADESGKWLGEGVGNVHDSRILFKRNFRFPDTGVYHFELQQAMRVSPLLQISDVGMRIERAEK